MTRTISLLSSAKSYLRDKFWWDSSLCHLRWGIVLKCHAQKQFVAKPRLDCKIALITRTLFSVSIATSSGLELIFFSAAQESEMQVAISRNDQTNDCRFNIHQFAKVNTEAGEPMFMTPRHASKPCLHCIASQTCAYWGLPTNLGKSGQDGSGKAGNKSRLVPQIRAI